MKKIFVIVIAAAMLFWAGCDLATNNNTNNDPINIIDIEVPYDFAYNTSQSVDVNLIVTTPSDDPVQGIVFKIYQCHPDDGGHLIAKGITQADGVYSTSLIVAEGCDSLTVIGYMNALTLPIVNSEVTFEYGNFPYGEKGSAYGMKGDSKAWSYLPGISYNAMGTPSPILNRPVDAGLLSRINAALPEYTNATTAHPEYFASDVSPHIWLDQNADVFMTFVHEGAGYKNSLGFFDFPSLASLPVDPTSLIRTIVFPNLSFPSAGELQTDDALQLGSYTAGTYIGTFLVSNGWISGSTVSETQTVLYSPKKYERAAGAQVVALYDGISGKIVVSYEDIPRPGGDMDFNDAIFLLETNPPDLFNTDSLYHLSEPVDDDGDGVPDDEDDYPDDGDRAFNNYYPAEGVYGTLAFEDNWPSKGDYDFNDIVIDYNFNQVTNASNELVDIHGSFKLRAVGAGYHNGFAVQLPVGAPNYYAFNNYGNTTVYIDNGNTNAVVVLFQDAFDLMQEPPGTPSTWINTVETEPYVTPAELEFTYTLGTPLDVTTLTYLPPYNPFIYVNDDRQKEIHLPDYAPTSKMTGSPYWGTADDDSHPATDRYFKTSNNLPWAIHIATSWDYPIEKIQITWAYLKFAAWAESGGTEHTNWYDIAVPGNVSTDNIYSQ